MEFNVEKTHIRDLLIITPEVFKDERGFFTESYRKDKFSAFGLDADFVQDNHSGSSKDVIRGLHFQWEPFMGKLTRVTRGTALVVAVDIRTDSPTLGQHIAVEVSADNRKLVYAPVGFASGFCILSDFAEIQYKCTGVYTSTKAESGIRWNDPALGINWPVKNPILSQKDENAQTLEEWLQKPESKNFRY